MPQVEVAQITVDGASILLADDPYSDRIRCDHPGVDDGEALGRALLRTAHARDRGRVIVLANDRLAAGLHEVGFELEGTMPGFYRGEEDCSVLGAYPDPGRQQLAAPGQAETVLQILEAKPGLKAPPDDVTTRRADVGDAEALAALLANTFDQYPTPSSDPAYLEAAIADGTPFRVVEEQGDIVACASADLVRSAETAELTDCASMPEHRGRGFMQAILHDLMGDLVTMGYPTAFTLARARIPGVNLAFQRRGFTLRGIMPQSCRIGEGIEDMNIWSRDLANIRPAPTPFL